MGIPQNLGFGLDKLVESRHLIQHDASRAVYGGYATEQAAAYAGMAILDADSDRVLVDIVPTGKIDAAALRAALEASIPSLTVKAEDATYRNGVGVIEAYVSVDDAETLARADGVKAVFLALKPYTRLAPVPSPSVVDGDHLNKIGTAFDQGVIQHRVDRISQLYNPSAPVNYDGSGISIGILSDSYDTRSASPHAATGVANFDLPGAAGNPWNTQPVVVLQDEPGGTDEGRGMVEIVYKMAPKARLAFATADEGEVGFANNIRALAGLRDYTYPDDVQQGFKADVIADDVGYFDEPWYQDGIISAGIDDVAAAGVSYFSAAANDIGINGYESALRIVPNGAGTTSATNSALIGTNINLSGVPANLYAGGFHNFNPNAGQQDVAQLVNLTSSSQYVIMQWDDPYDTRDLELDQPPIFSATGTISSLQTSVTYDQNSTPPLPPFAAGQAYVITEWATSGNFDAIINIYDGAGNLVLNQDTGTDETVTFYPPTSGQYRIVVNRYSTTTGNFSLTVNTADGSAGVTTDLNLLVFNTAGAFQSSRSLTANNLATNRPIEIGYFGAPSGGQVQFVVARSNTPTQPQSKLPTRVRWLIPGNGAAGLGPAEYFNYNSVTTGGHATAAGCNGTAAYSVFKPNVPESFTSPGPATIFFDKDSNRLPVPEVRQQPRVAAADAANTSFFTSDTTNDLDSNPNFSGTSAAAPHAAAVAALVLQSRGGPGSVSPEEMTQILQDSAFPHDLDPNYAAGRAYTTDGGVVTVAISSDNDSNNLTGVNDTSSFQIFYAGSGTLASITFNQSGAAATGGNVTGGNNGPMNDVGSSPATITYFENNYPGMAFLPATKAFTLGPLTGLAAADVSAPASTLPYTGFSNLTPAPGNGLTQFNTMTIGFPNGNFGAGGVVRFTVGRGVQHSAVTGNGVVIGAGTIATQYSADMFGGGVMIPSGIVLDDGMTFTGTTTGGGTFSGVIRNNIGRGYSTLDGYGFIDASVATGTLRGVPAASPESGYRGDPVLFTVQVTPGSVPDSTQLAVTANLVDIGGAVAQPFYDDGTHGDRVAGDDVFSFATASTANAPVGAHALPVVVSDHEGRTGNAQINYTVLASTAPSGVGSAAPAAVAQTEYTTLAVAVTPGAGPTSSGLVVSADLAAIGGGIALFHDDGQNGDAVAGDDVYSYVAMVATGVAAGDKSLPVTIADAQGRSGSTAIALSVLAPTAPSGVGAATPSTVAGSGTTLLTVQTTPGSNPISTGLSVVADLTGIGGGSAVAFHDDGQNGDAVAGDGVYSYFATVPFGTAAGAKSLPVTIVDAQSRTATTGIALTVLAPTSIAVTAAATPSSASPGGTALFTAAVTGGTNPASTGITVSADLSGIGGSPAQTLYDDGTHGDVTPNDGTYSFLATVAADATPGAKLITVAVDDAQGRTATAAIAFGVQVQETGALSGAGVPAAAELGTTAQVALAVAVVPGSNPASTDVTVTVDLSAVGGSAAQAFYDDGTHGDQIAGDDVFTFLLPLAGVAPGVYTLPATIADAQGRAANASIRLTLSDDIFDDGFDG
ncbi:MAG TPA: choice-of-anchor X domain-containing protein [Dokdonella sp.]